MSTKSRNNLEQIPDSVVSTLKHGTTCNTIRCTNVCVRFAMLNFVINKCGSLCKKTLCGFEHSSIWYRKFCILNGSFVSLVLLQRDRWSLSLISMFNALSLFRIHLFQYFRIHLIKLKVFSLNLSFWLK